MMNTATLLTRDQVEQFHRDGYVAVHDLLSAEEIAAAKRELTVLLEVDLANQGNPDPNLKLRIEFEKGYDSNSFSNLGDLELKVRKFFWFVDGDQYFQRMVGADHRISRIVEQLLGDKPLLFQDMALVKPPFIGREKPWHQDNAYFAVTPLEAVCGVWIALDDATVENGCMCVLPGEHLTGARKHVHDLDCEIPVASLDTSKKLHVPVPAGGALFFYGMLPHYTAANHTDQRRRALQFHFRSESSQIIPTDDYFKIFAENGEAASCAASLARGL